ncbi:MAG TPA: hypothetical protein VL527_00515, partial [Dongiaceae bacterium]|nr:hypothetical protein [Dongiaceae bacterium]
MAVELTEELLRAAAGWDVMKLARAYLAQGQVLSSYWAAPLLRGVVQAGELSFRASMVIKSASDIENLCTCRDAREWGKVCAHGVAVGLHWLQAQQPVATPARPAARSQSEAKTAAPKISAWRRDAGGEPVGLHVVFPPNLDQAIARGKVMLVFEGQWSGGRMPLNALPRGRTYTFSAQDNAILDCLETLTDGEMPALLQMDLPQLSTLLPLLRAHPHLTLGKKQDVTVSSTPLTLPLRANLETNGEITLQLRQPVTSLAIVGDWVWQVAGFQLLGVPDAARAVLQGPMRLTRTQVPQFLSQSWPQLQAAGGMEANFKLEDFTLEPQAPKFHLQVAGGLAQLRALLQCAYGPRIMTVGVTASDETVWLPDPEVPTRYSTRNFNAERAALARLQRSGFSSPDS